MGLIVSLFQSILLDDFTTFLCFSNIIVNPSFMFFFITNEEFINQCLKLFDIIFKLNLPLLFQHFKDETLMIDNFFKKWASNFFINCLETNIVVKILDLLFLMGSSILYKSAIG